LFSRTLGTEISEIVAGGLTDLGFSCRIQMFTFEPACMNIVMPAVLFPMSEIDRIPRTTMFYNTEDLEHQPEEKQRVVIELARRGFPVWDYARKNLAWFAAQGFPDRVRHVPLGYAKAIDRVRRRPWEERDIDVLFYGKLSQRRVDVVAALMQTNLTVGVFSHAYGDLRDDLVSRSKLVLNIPAKASFVAECPRSTFLAANQRLCIAERPSYPLQPGWSDAIHYVAYSELIATCQALASNRDAVLALETKAYAAMRALPISTGLAEALAAVTPRAV